MSEQTTTTEDTTTTDTVPTLDLTSVSPEDYQACLERVLAAGAAVATRHSWCSGWMTYLMNVSPHYGRMGVIEIPAEETLDRSWFTDEGWTEYYAKFNAARGEELRRLRGRILTYAEQGDINVEDANAVFAAAGLPLYAPDPEQNGYVLYFGGSTRTRRDTVSNLNHDEYRALVQEQEQAFLNAVGYAAQNTARGSFVTVDTRRLPRVRQEDRTEILYRT